MQVILNHELYGWLQSWHLQHFRAWEAEWADQVDYADLWRELLGEDLQ